MLPDYVLTTRLNSLFKRSKTSLPPVLPCWAGLLPWVVFGAMQELYPLLAAPLALVVFILLYWRSRLSLPPLDAGMFAYFFIYSVLSLTGQAQILPPRFLFALCPAVLAITATLSVALGRPFTLAYARRYAPQHLSARPGFFKGNQIISLAWAIGFTAAAIAISTLSGEWKPAQATLILVSILGSTVIVSAVIGSWVHVRLSRIAI